MNVPAVQIPQYTVAVPTISNAASDDFVVTAHATTPSIWVITDPISGQSVDNLAPAQPSPFTGAYGSGTTHLTWGANGEGDLEGYRLYRGTSAAFVPSLANRIATPSGTTFDDVGPAGRFYKLSAADVNGNESSFALLTPGATTDVESVEPMEFALSGAQPNPARGGDLNVAFALPDDAPAQLELLDVSGRRVRSREVGSLGTGRHVVNLAQGRSVPAGMYWLRLSQGAQKSRKRVVVIE
jgi:hypothetical protein